MANYLITHYKGKYRLKAPYDLDTNQYPRDLNGNFSDYDVYIDCQHGIQIGYYGKSLLDVYIPSIGRGHNIVKAIKEKLGSDVIYNKEETDAEVMFKIHVKYMEDIAEFVKPKTNGAGISPFSSKNLYKAKYSIPDEDLAAYKSIVANLPQNQLLTLAHTSKNFLSTLTNKRYKPEDLKADMAKCGLSGKEYIHSIGKWDEYLEFLKEQLKNRE